MMQLGAECETETDNRDQEDFYLMVANWMSWLIVVLLLPIPRMMNNNITLVRSGMLSSGSEPCPHLYDYKDIHHQVGLQSTVEASSFGCSSSMNH
jgi:hypothetical protein